MFVGCLTSQQHASVSQGRICSDNFTCCHTEIEAADQAFYLTQSQYTNTGPTSPSADPISPGAWQGSHWSANFEVTGMTRPRKKSRRKRDSNPGSPALEADALPLGQRGGRERERARDRQTDRQTDGRTDGRTDRQRDRQRQTDRQTDRQKQDKQTDGQTHRHTDTQRQTDTQKQDCPYSYITSLVVIVSSIRGPSA